MISPIATIFFDIGGVCLTNGWDANVRRSAASHFSIDLDEFDERHQALIDTLSVRAVAGRYLDYVSLHRLRPFSRDAFIGFCGRSRSHTIQCSACSATLPQWALQAGHDQQRVARAESLSHRHVSARDIFTAFFSLLSRCSETCSRITNCLDVIR